jgi:hypothetical protein
LKSRKPLLAPAILFCAGIVFFPAGMPAQEFSAKPTNGAIRAAPDLPPGSPPAALRDALSAACSQSQKEFAKFLMGRSAQTFSQLTPTARIALMKRFVLLNEIGKSSVSSDSSGRPMVRCETPAGTAEIQIGAADVTDNLVFLPMDVRAATDAVGNNVAHVKIGLVREGGAWKLLSVGLLLLDLPSLAAEWDAAEMDSTERAAVEATKAIAEAIETYRRTYSRLPDSLSKLGPPPGSAAATAEAAGLLDAELAGGTKGGYVFRYVIAGANAIGAPAKYELAATPRTYGRTGRHSFFRDSAGGLHGADRQGAVGSAADPKVQ